MNKVIVSGLNYSEIIPEAIFSTVKISKFLPQQTGDQTGGQVVRFFLQGPGFFDPYSAYLKFTVRINDAILGAAFAPNQGDYATDNFRGLFLDDSAHSIINRIVIRSQGVELERIEQYDVLAKMINDILYSREQKVLHHFEGFNTQHQIMDLQNTLLPYNTVRKDINLWEHVPTDLFIGNVLVGVNNEQYVTIEADTQLGIAPQNLAQGEAPQNTGNEYTFCIPLYSGIVGVLMPVKKFIPLSVMPLEIEFTINPHAMYSVNQNVQRAFFVKNMQIQAHVLTFEQELHRSMDSVIAEHGLFINYKTFQQSNGVTFSDNAQNVQATVQLNTSAKSINSIHMVFLCTNFSQFPNIKKLSFLSHDLQSLQIKNGLEYIPSEPITGNMRFYHEGQHVPFLIEMYKSWGKLHDPNTDSAITPYRYCRNYIAGNRFIPNEAMGAFRFRVMSTFGQAQYGISLEGEQMGADSTVITGKKAQMPLEITFSGLKSDGGSTYPFIFYRSDKVVYIRPDLVVQKLGD